jgi:uncharacterized protein
MAHTVCWFDLTVSNMERATKFYEAVLDGKLEIYTYEGITCAVFPHKENDVAGCLVENPSFKPSSNDGLLMYFNVDGRLDAALAEVEKFGGKVLEPKHPIGQHGFRAVLLDSEGNRIALHSM